ncbi:MAG: sigma-70 family RNA polymerase sigma factor [Chloroflexota bacterium]
MQSDILGDDELMARIRAKDSSALELLYDRYAATALGLAAKITQDQATAEEVVQESFWRIWSNADSYTTERGSIANWFFGIVRYGAIDQWRRRQSRPQPVDSEDEEQLFRNVADPSPGVADVVWANLTHNRLRTAMNRLPREQYRVLEMAYFQGLTRQEIARATGEPLGTVHTRARLALQKMRELLAGQGLDE